MQYPVSEAIIEDNDVRADIFKKPVATSDKDFICLTNTSSILIYVLNIEASLGGRIIRFHFYKLRTEKRLSELISAKQTN